MQNDRVIPIEPSREDVGELLTHIARYRLSTFAAIARRPRFADDGPRRVRQLLRLCESQQLVNSAALHHASRYWFLTATGAARCGLPAERSGPLSAQARIRAAALLQFCCLSKRERHRLTADELKQHFPDLYRPGMPGSYYFKPQGVDRIGLARVDAAHLGRWDRVIQTIRQDITDHTRQPGFRRLIEAGRFEITLLTVLPHKAERIAQSLSELPETRHVPVHIVAQPELLPLVTSSHGKEVFRTRIPRHGFHRSRPRSTEKQRARP